MLVINETRGVVIGASIKVADSSAIRRRGLLGRTDLAEGEGLWITPCEAIHTWFMKFAIDVIYLDRDGRVRKVVRSLQPWKISACLQAHSVLELPSGTTHRTGTSAGDRLTFS